MTYEQDECEKNKKKEGRKTSPPIQI